MENRTQINILVDEGLFKAAKIKAIKTDRKISEVLREKLAEWVKEEPAPQPAKAAKGK